MTSNPTIFAKAIEGEAAYDEQFASLVPPLVEDAYWELVITDITDALGVLRPAPRRERRRRRLRVPRGGAGAGPRHRAATVAMARPLHERIDRPNLLVKIPATAEGVPAIRQ